MKYERLTYHSNLGLTNRRGTEQEVIDRLAELEDKLESEQLVELPCKVGEMVWYINTTPSISLKVNKIYEGKVVRFHILNLRKPIRTTVCADIQICNEYGTTEVPDVTDFGKKWFTDKSQAEACLKEIQERL